MTEDEFMTEKDYLRPGERVDHLDRKGYRIIQNPSSFCFGMDAVLLSAFAKVNPGEQVMDLGTGTGILPILMEARFGAGAYTALEIQPEMAEMASRSVKMNGLEEKIAIHCSDLRRASEHFGKSRYDVVISNPPYINGNRGMVNPDSGKAMARHEITCTLEDVTREAAALLKPGGRFYLVHRPGRLADILEELLRVRLEPKRLRMVHSYADQEANLVLIEASRGGNRWMKAEPPLIIFQSPGEYTEEVQKLYSE